MCFSLCGGQSSVQVKTDIVELIPPVSEKARLINLCRILPSHFMMSSITLVVTWEPQMCMSVIIWQANVHWYSMSIEVKVTEAHPSLCKYILPVPRPSIQSCRPHGLSPSCGDLSYHVFIRLPGGAMCNCDHSIYIRFPISPYKELLLRQYEAALPIYPLCSFTLCLYKGTKIESCRCHSPW